MKRINTSFLAIKNIKRNLFRSLSVALSVAVIAAALFFITTIMQTINTSLQKGSARLGTDIVVVPYEDIDEAEDVLLNGTPETFYLDADITEQVQEIAGVQKVSEQTLLRSLDRDCCQIPETLIVGFDPQSDFALHSWLPDSWNDTLEADQVIIGNDLNQQLAGSIKLYGKQFTIINALDKTGMNFYDNSVFMNISSLRTLMNVSPGAEKKNKTSMLLIQVDPTVNVATTAVIIEQNVDRVATLTSEEMITTIRSQIFMLLKGIVTTGLVVWSMSMVLIGIVFSTIVNERKTEIGLFRAMGAKKRTVVQLILKEAILLAAIGGVLGILCAASMLFIFAGSIAGTLGIASLSLSLGELLPLVFVCFILSILTGAGAACWPAFRSVSMEPYTSIHEI